MQVLLRCKLPLTQHTVGTLGDLIGCFIAKVQPVDASFKALIAIFETVSCLAYCNMKGTASSSLVTLTSKP